MQIKHKRYLLCNTFVNMAKKFACGDVVNGCGWSTVAKDETELFQRISEHAKKVHNMAEIPDKIIQQVKSKIQDA